MSDIIINNKNNENIIIEELMKNNPFNSINNMLIHNRCWLCELPFQRGTIKYVFQISDLLSYYHQLYLLSLQNNVDKSVKNDNNDDDAAAATDVVKNEKDHDKVDVNDSNNINHDYGDNDDDNDYDNNRSNHPNFLSNNLRQCYQYYITMLQLSSKNQKDINQQQKQTTQQQQYQNHNTNDNIKAHYLLQSFDNHQIQTWMSGLICKTNSNCQQEMIYFIKRKPSSSPSSSSAAASSTTASTDGSSRIENHIFQPISIMNNNNKNCLPGCGCDNPWPFLSS
jgi:hypothetical protein